MDRIFSIDGKVFQFISFLMNLITINILFIIFCIPIATAGASFTAMYSVTLKLADNQEPYVIRAFWKSFCANFKVSTIVWVIIVLAELTIIVNLRVLSMYGNSILSMLELVIYLMAVITAFISTYVFVTIAKYENTIQGYFKFALLISVRHLPKTILLALTDMLPVMLLLFIPMLSPVHILALFMLGAALPAYLKSKCLLSVFENYILGES